MKMSLNFSNIKRRLIAVLLCLIAFLLGSFAQAQVSGLYLNPDMRGRIKNGGIAGGGTKPGVRGNVQKRVSSDKDLSSVLKKEVNFSRLDAVLEKMLRVITELKGLSEGARGKYQFEIRNFQMKTRQVFILDQIFIPGRTGFYAVHAVTENAGKAGQLTEAPIYLSRYVTEQTLADFELSEEDLRETANMNDREKLTYMIEKVFKGTTSVSSEEAYLQYKLFVNILHELTHEVIPDGIFERREGDLNDEEEEFVVAVTDAIVNNKPFGEGPGWDYLKKGKSKVLRREVNKERFMQLKRDLGSGKITPWKTIELHSSPRVIKYLGKGKIRERILRTITEKINIDPGCHPKYFSSIHLLKGEQDFNDMICERAHENWRKSFDDNK